MPTIMSHAVVGIALGTLTSFPTRRRAFWLLSAALPALPDLDVFGTASHGVLDALTNGGPGVVFFAPFDGTCYFFPWRPIPVSPLASGFFSEWGWRVFSAELTLIWLPAGVVALAARGLPRR